MASFISMVFAILKDEGVDTTDMTPKEAIDKFNELGLGDKDKLKQEEIDKHKSSFIKADNGYTKTATKQDTYNVEQFNEEYREEVVKFNIDPTKTEQEKFEKTYNFYGKYQIGTANKDNFYYNSIAKFEDIGGRPKGRSDYVSYTRDGKISSKYWYKDGVLIRGSDHWGNGVAGCDWAIDSIKIKSDYLVTKTPKKYGKVKFEDINFKTEVVTINGTNHFVGFDNVVDYKRGTRAYKINGEVYINKGPITYYEFVKADYDNGIYSANLEETIKLRNQKLERKAIEAREAEEKRKELLKRSDVFDTNSVNIPNKGDLFLVDNNELVKIEEIIKNDMNVIVKLENNRHYLLQNIKAK